MKNKKPQLSSVVCWMIKEGSYVEEFVTTLLAGRSELRDSGDEGVSRMRQPRRRSAANSSGKRRKYFVRIVSWKHAAQNRSGMRERVSSIAAAFVLCNA